MYRYFVEFLLGEETKQDHVYADFYMDAKYKACIKFGIEPDHILRLF